MIDVQISPRKGKALLTQNSKQQRHDDGLTLSSFLLGLPARSLKLAGSTASQNDTSGNLPLAGKLSTFAA